MDEENQNCGERKSDLDKSGCSVGVGSAGDSDYQPEETFRSPSARKFGNHGLEHKPEKSRPSSMRKLEFDTSESSRNAQGFPVHLDVEHSVQRNVLEAHSGKVAYSDRFIPSRTSSSFSTYSIVDKNLPKQSPPSGAGREDGAAAYASLLRTELFGADAALISLETSESTSSALPREASSPLETSPIRNVFRFRNSGGGLSPSGTESQSPYSVSPIGYDGDPPSGSNPSPKKPPRRIAKSPFKVLDAPALVDDFYLNLVDWSDNNLLAVGLGTCVYLWNALTSKVTKLCDLEPDDSVRAVGWAPRSNILSVGTKKGQVQIWDAERCSLVRSLGGHRSRVGTLAWGASCLASGGRDRTVLLHDARLANSEGPVSQLEGHLSEVCGLKWSADDKELASGGNDNQLLIWNKHACQPVLTLKAHRAAVKAIAWSPHQHSVLASGGGTADKCLRFWNTSTGASLSCVDTGSQVCNLAWSRNVNELVSTHGYSQNQVVVWRYPTMSKLATLTGHAMRVLFLAVSPDGQTIVTGAGDETLRFWNVFPPSKTRVSPKQTGVWSLGSPQIR